METEKIKDYHLTNASESVAWSGTLFLMRDNKGYYFEYHTGNSNDPVVKKYLPENVNIREIKNMNVKEANEYRLWLFDRPL